MAISDDLPAALISQFGLKNERRWRLADILLGHPAAAFVFFSMLFGAATAILTPPLEGPDEPGHFLHAYGISRGTIVPTDVDGKGRRGIFVPARLYDVYSIFEDVTLQVWTREFDSQQYWAEYMRVRAAERRAAGLRNVPHIPRRPAPIFVPNQGQEVYSPAAYLPQVGAAWLARLADSDFVATLFSMRLAGLVIMTAVTAYAITIAGPLRWAFFMIGMLPAALYGRSVVSADGAALAYSMLITALCFRTARLGSEECAWVQSLVMTLCVLTKPPQIAFIVLTAMKRPLQDLRRHWRTTALIILPGCILSMLWILAVSESIVSVRILEGTDSFPNQFTASWKLRFMLEHPLHFPQALITSLRSGHEYWLQLIGVLGWLDTQLQPWVYPTLTVMLIFVCLVPLELERCARFRIALVSGAAAFAYFLAVFAIFFVVWTPISSAEVQGVQGRYFLPALPSVALAIWALLNRGLSQRAVAVVALCGAILSGGAVIEAILRVSGLPFGLSN
jgi:uncharacterized membrane protein